MQSAGLAGCVTVVMLGTVCFDTATRGITGALCWASFKKSREACRLQAASREDRGAIAHQVLDALNRILADDRAAGSELRQRNQPDRSTRTTPSES
jgi:hypothetical protein